MSKRAFPIFVLLFFSVLRVVCAQNVEINTTIDKRAANVGEEIHLTVRVVGAQGNVQAPRIPALKGFDTYYTGRASQFSFINNQSTSSVEFSYVLVPREPGNFTLAPIDIVVNGQSFRSDPLNFDITDNGMPQASNSPSPVAPAAGQIPPPPMSGAGMPPLPQAADTAPAYVPEDRNLYVKAWVDKTEVYPNEQILLSYSLYTRYDTRYEGFEKKPEISGFWIEEFPDERDVPRETVTVNGLRYVKADVKRTALFPTAAAEYTIDPGSLKVSIRQEPQHRSIFDEFFDDSFFSGGSFFSRRETRLLKPPAIKITVKPLPEAGKPKSFAGAVGNFRLSASVDKDFVKQNEPVTLRMVIEGEGNIETLNRPPISEIKGFKTYDADTAAQLFRNGYMIGGRKTFESVFIPTEAGKMTIPKIEFSFFNPQTKAYERLVTPDFLIQVEPSQEKFQLPQTLSQQAVFKKEVEVENRDIRFIHDELSGEKPKHFMTAAAKGFGGLNILLTVLILGQLIRLREEKKFAKDANLRRKRLAKAAALNRFKTLKKLERSRNPHDFQHYFEEMGKTLTHYLSDKFGLSTHGMTQHQLEMKLEEVLGAEDPLYKEIVGLYEICHASRFAGGAVGNADKHRAFQILKDTIDRVEKMKL